MPDTKTCPVTVYRGPPAPGRHADHPCGQPVARLGLCAHHVAEHDRLHAADCGRCGL